MELSSLSSLNNLEHFFDHLDPYPNFAEEMDPDYHEMNEDHQKNSAFGQNYASLLIFGNFGFGFFQDLYVEPKVGSGST